MKSALERLHTDYQRRQILAVPSKVKHSIHDGSAPEDIITAAVTDLERIGDAGISRNQRTTKQIADEAYAFDERTISGDYAGLPYPWTAFQLRTFGLPMRALTPLAGRDTWLCIDGY